MHQDIHFDNRILLGMSGGVDSAVSALLLMNQGYEVIGCTCLFCGSDTDNFEAVTSAKSVCNQIGIEHIVYDVRSSFMDDVIIPFCGDYAAGTTPSPCVMCNEKMKFPTLISTANEYGCRWIATGHYAKINSTDMPGGDKIFFISKHSNASKDQSYMLARLSQKILSRLVLPLSEVQNKDEVRAIASSIKLSCANKTDSQDICFAPDGYRKLMENMGYAIGYPGDIVNTEGEVLGRHDGLSNYTIGQRRGIGVSCPSAPLYVIRKDTEANQLVVGFQDELITNNFTISNVVRQKECLPSDELFCQTRYHMKPVKCSISYSQNGEAIVSTGMSVVRPAPRQYCVVYDGDDVVACGEIV